MKKQASNVQYCLLLSGTITEDLSKTIPDGTAPMFKVRASILMLSEEESRSAPSIQRLLVNRLPQNMEVLMCDEPNQVIGKLHSMENTKKEKFLALVIRGLL